MLRKEGSKWVCDFAEKDGKHVAWDRKALTFVRRADPPPAAAPAAVGGRNAAGKAPAAAPAAPPPERDSSDDEDEELDSEEEGEMQPPDDGEMQSADGWQRNDHVFQYAYGFCATCFPLGTTPTFACCGPSTGRNCFQQHSNGVGARHSMQKRKREDNGESSTAGLR